MSEIIPEIEHFGDHLHEVRNPKSNFYESNKNLSIEEEVRVH